MATSSATEKPGSVWPLRNRQCADECNPRTRPLLAPERHPEKPEYHVVLCVRQEYFAALSWTG